MSNDLIGRQIKGMSESIETWPTFDEAILQDEILNNYLRRKQAVKLYFQGYSKETIKKETNFGISHIYRLITERCLATHQDGYIYGWRGLIPNANIKEYKRKTTINVDNFGYGASGALGFIFDCYPEIKLEFDKRVLKTKSNNLLKSTEVPRLALWRWFLDRLREHGFEETGKWPFNTKTMGYTSINRYVDNLLFSNPKAAIKSLASPEVEKKIKSNDGVDRPKLNVYQRVEMDSHKLDGRFCIMIPQIDGGHTAKIIHRLWVTVIVEVTSRAVLGYYLSLGKEVNKNDIIRTIKMALSVWRPRENLFSEISYYEGAGFPSSMSPLFASVCWDETNIDGALAEKCNTVETLLRDVVKSNLHSPDSGFLSRRSLDDRPYVETFFRQLSQGAFHKLSNTTGSKPEDIQGRKPDQIAINSQFQLEYVEELLDVLIANYNVTPHTSLGFRSPLKYLEFLSSRSDTTLRYADPDLVKSLLSYRKKCPVVGNLTQGRKPHVNFEGARYSNEILKQRYDLIGQSVWITNHFEDDARLVQCTTLDGHSLGVLRAAPPWHKLPHSLKIRKQINSLISNKKLFLSVNEDAVEGFLNFCEKQNNKLPVYPGYLEIRRILSQQRESLVDENILAINTDTESSNDPSDKRDHKLKNNKKSVSNDLLPPRRMAVSGKPRL